MLQMLYVRASEQKPFLDIQRFINKNYYYYPTNITRDFPMGDKERYFDLIYFELRDMFGCTLLLISHTSLDHCDRFFAHYKYNCTEHYLYPTDGDSKNTAGYRQRSVGRGESGGKD